MTSREELKKELEDLGLCQAYCGEDSVDAGEIADFIIADRQKYINCLKTIRPWMVPNMNWSDEIGQKLLDIVDEILLKERT